MLKHSYGYIPDNVDDRDYFFRIDKPLVEKPVLPPSVDLRPFCSPVRDQGNLGACTGFATVTGFREFAENKTVADFVELSPMFLYYQERVLEGTVNEDSGATMRDGMKALKDWGVCPEKDYPYNESKFTVKPACSAYRHAKPFKIKGYYRLLMLDDMKQCLASGFGFTLGFTVYESFESSYVASTGKMPVPTPNEHILGGHAVFAVGYKDDPAWAGGGYLIVKNSWGTDWGDNGYFYMPYEFAKNGDWVSDAWVGVL